ncbi:MAG: hypothetical protein NUV51_01985 [Sulfuricaulis sp.]|nr:hypothetical protein [Sulfuricaulis sp.]
MSDTIEDFKYVELNYRIVDVKTGDILRAVEYPLGYVHGANDVLSEKVQTQLKGKKAGDTIDIPIDVDQLYGPRDETQVFTDHIDNVPEEYREVGMTITAENEKGEKKSFIVTRVDEKTVTVDGNNPLCGREVKFTIEVLAVRDATDAEIDCGGAVGADPDINEILQ